MVLGVSMRRKEIKKKKEQEIMFSKIHKKINSSNIRLANYKLIHSAFSTNAKFKNRYDNKVLNEDLENIFIKFNITKQCFQ